MKPRHGGTAGDPFEGVSGDIVVRDGQIYIRGKTLARVQRKAKAAGLTVKRYVNQMLREKLNEPGWLDGLIKAHNTASTEEIHARCVVRCVAKIGKRRGK